MKYKLNPDHAYIVVFTFFVLGAAIKFVAQYVHSEFSAQVPPPEQGFISPAE